MKSKRLLRFYFGADGLERALNNLILHCALRAGEGRGESCANRIALLIGQKDELGLLWKYLDGVMGGLCGEDRQVLKSYAAMRTGIKRADPVTYRRIRAAVIKFTRHARFIANYSAGIKALNEYYCLF